MGVYQGILEWCRLDIFAHPSLLGIWV